MCTSNRFCRNLCIFETPQRIGHSQVRSKVSIFVHSDINKTNRIKENIFLKSCFCHGVDLFRNRPRRCISVNFAKFLRTLFLHSTTGPLLLAFDHRLFRKKISKFVIFRIQAIIFRSNFGQTFMSFQFQTNCLQCKLLF